MGSYKEIQLASMTIAWRPHVIIDLGRFQQAAILGGPLEALSVKGNP